MHNKKERAHSTMGLVESDISLYTTKMESKDTLDEYYRVIKAQVNTTKTHSGNIGYHSTLYREHYKAYVKSKRYDTEEKLAAVTNTDVKKMRAKALKSSSGAYIR
jgi:hypothetical protein